MGVSASGGIFADEGDSTRSGDGVAMGNGLAEVPTYAAVTGGSGCRRQGLYLP